MFGIFNDLEPIFPDNSFDLFSNFDCVRSPKIPPFSPIHLIDEPYDIGLINFQKNNSEEIKTNICTKTKLNGFKKPTIKIKKNRGRKRKDESRAVFHTKISQDNIIKKIKGFFLKYLNKILNDSLCFPFEYKQFYKLTSKINENLRKDFNIRLMDMTIREIYEEFPPDKTRDQSVKKKNYDLIQEIFNNYDNTKTIEILNTKYIDLLETLEAKEYIVKKIEKKNEKLEDKIEYIGKVKELLEQFKEWFTKKKKRKYKLRDEENNRKIKNN